MLPQVKSLAYRMSRKKKPQHKLHIEHEKAESEPKNIRLK